MTAIATARTHACGGPTVTHSPYFGVSHEAIAETNSKAMSMQSAVTVVLRDGVHVGGIARGDGVALHVLLWRDAPSIVDAACAG